MSVSVGSYCQSAGILKILKASKWESSTGLGCWLETLQPRRFSFHTWLIPCSKNADQQTEVVAPTDCCNLQRQGCSHKAASRISRTNSAVIFDAGGWFAQIPCILHVTKRQVQQSMDVLQIRAEIAQARGPGALLVGSTRKPPWAPRIISAVRWVYPHYHWIVLYNYHNSNKNYHSNG